MVCQDVERNELVARYLTGQLESDMQDDFELHLLECRNCQLSLEMMLAEQDSRIARLVGPLSRLAQFVQQHPLASHTESHRQTVPSKIIRPPEHAQGSEELQNTFAQLRAFLTRKGK